MSKKNDQLRRQNDLYKRVLSSIPDFLAYKNTSGIYEVSSEGVNQLYKNRFDSIIGKTVDEIYSKDAAQNVKELDKEAYSLGKSINRLFEAETDDGLLMLDSTRTPIYDDKGNEMGILSISRDVSELVKVKNRLEEISYIQTVIIEISRSFVGAKAQDFTGILNQSLSKLGSILDADRSYLFTYNFIENTMNNTYEWTNNNIKSQIGDMQDIPITDYLQGWVDVHRENEYLLVSDVELLDKSTNLYNILQFHNVKSLLTMPIFIEGECYGFVGFEAIKTSKNWEDIPTLLNLLPDMYSSFISQHQILKELAFAKETAQKANNIQSDFIAKMTHEIRTPINGLANALYLMEDSNLTSDQQEYIEVMNYSIEALGSLVNNILDYSKIEANKVKYNTREINLENEIIKILKVNKYMASNKELGLYLNYDYAIPTTISTDIEKLRQILNNLIQNAIKYTNYGHVNINVSTVKKNLPYIDVLFEIEDTGIGIPKDNMKHIFDEFYQVGDALNKRPQGTGLGLTIANELISFLKGDLKVSSVVREGSTFSFTLTFYAPLKEKRYQLNQDVLVIDLSKGLHSNVETLINTHFKSVEICNPKTLSTCLNQTYDIVFIYTNTPKYYQSNLDIIKPVLMQLNKNVKKVLLYDNVKIATFTDTFDLYDYTFELPDGSEKIIDVLTSKEKEQGKTMMPKETQTLIEKRHKILLVDDNNINRRVMSQLLKGMYIDVTEAKNGFESIELVKENKFDIIFMDIFMPGIDGYETSKRIRALGSTASSVPIIAVTANDAETTKEKMIEYGMNGVLTKPLKKEDLHKLLQEYFTKQDVSISQNSNIPSIFNQEEYETYYSDIELRKDIIQTFIDEEPKDKARIKNAFLSKDCDLIYKAAHYMKGSFTYLKAKKNLDMSMDIMKYCEKGMIKEALSLEKTYIEFHDILLIELKEYLNIN